MVPSFHFIMMRVCALLLFLTAAYAAPNYDVLTQQLRGLKSASATDNSADGSDGYIYADCEMKVNDAEPLAHPDKVTGGVYFRQKVGGSLTEIKFNITGFSIEDKQIYHGFHVHEYGDLSDGCSSSGSHYNPLDVDHGAPFDSALNRHVGDLGNIEEDSEGHCHEVITDRLIQLSGQYSVIGRAAVIHQTYDDLGRTGVDDSSTTGNAGDRLSCCVIGLTDDQHWQD